MAVDAASHDHHDHYSEGKRSEVSAFRVPFQNWAGRYGSIRVGGSSGSGSSSSDVIGSSGGLRGIIGGGGDAHRQQCYYSQQQHLDQSPLHLVAAAAHKLHRLEVFESPLMTACIEFKWEAFARRLFYGQFLFFLSFLAAVVAFSLCASRTARSRPWAEDYSQHSSTSLGGDDGSYGDDGGGDGHGYGHDDGEDALLLLPFYPSLGSLWGCTDGRVALVLCPVV